MKYAALLVVCVCAILTGCTNSSSWTLKEWGDERGQLAAAEQAVVPPVVINAPRAEVEVRHEEWATIWPTKGAEDFAEGVTDADGPIAAVAAPAAQGKKLAISVTVDELYNGNGYSFWGSDPAYITITARITTADGSHVATLVGKYQAGDYKGGGNFDAFMYRLGEELSDWFDDQR